MTGKYQAYAEYKDSGVQWLDKVPVHWTSVPIKYMALEKNSLFLDGDWIESKDLSDEGIRYITTGNVGEGEYKEQGAGYITEDKFYKINCTEVFEGDILISRLNSPIGRSCIVPDLESRIVTSVDNVIFRPDQRYSKNYLVHLFSSEGYFKHTGNLARGATMQRISRGLLGNIRVVVPSLKEQTQIANFLDHETAKIDTLIEKQQQLIKLLKEKRQAVISHAVTKGLNPNAPMRDSGVEWLGEVPEHWEVVPLKHLCCLLKDGTHLPPPRVDSGIPLLSVRNIVNSKFIFRDDDSNISEEDYKNLCKPFVPRKGDVLLAIVGATLGKVAIVEEMSEFHIQRSLAIFRAQPDSMTSDGLANIFGSTNFQSLLWENVGFSAQPGIYLGALENFQLPVPPLVEQNEINKYCKSKAGRISRLILKAENANELMKERRTALISAAVTGKIDVRNWQAPNV
ncbi:MAG: restriction endonuclease subunit S [Methylococcaceae bacterium]